jgi:hypothetical protein
MLFSQLSRLPAFELPGFTFLGISVPCILITRSANRTWILGIHFINMALE